jgi:hypothetical protein
MEYRATMEHRGQAIHLRPLTSDRSQATSHGALLNWSSISSGQWKSACVASPANIPLGSLDSDLGQPPAPGREPFCCEPLQLHRDQS